MPEGSIVDYVRQCTVDGLREAGVDEKEGLGYITEDFIGSMLSEARPDSDGDSADAEQAPEGWLHYGWKLVWMNPWLVYYQAACGTARWKWYGPPKVEIYGNCGSHRRYRLTHATRGPVQY